MLANRFKQGRSSPCLFLNKESDLRVAVHGDEFGVLGPWRQVLWLRQILEEVLDITYRGVIGSNLPKNVGVQEVRILGRIVTLMLYGYRWEADPKHAKTIIDRAGITKGNGVGTLTLAASAYE